MGGTRALVTIREKVSYINDAGLAKDFLASLSVNICAGHGCATHSSADASDKVVIEVHKDVADRLVALEPALVAQDAAAKLLGTNVASSKGLVSHDIHFKANAARHLGFESDDFGSLPISELKRRQRGPRKHSENQGKCKHTGEASAFIGEWVPLGTWKYGVLSSTYEISEVGDKLTFKEGDKHGQLVREGAWFIGDVIQNDTVVGSIRITGLSLSDGTPFAVSQFRESDYWASPSVATRCADNVKGVCDAGSLQDVEQLCSKTVTKT